MIEVLWKTVKVACIKAIRKGMLDIVDSRKRTIPKTSTRHEKDFAVPAAIFSLKDVQSRRSFAKNNNESSRSHAIFKLFIENGTKNAILIIGNFAGNERRDDAEVKQTSNLIREDLSALQMAYTSKTNDPKQNFRLRGLLTCLREPQMMVSRLSCSREDSTKMICTRDR